MSAEATITRTWQVGQRTVTLSMRRPEHGGSMSAVIEWEPTMPTRLSAQEIVEYRAGRDRALAEISQELGIQAVVVEV